MYASRTIRLAATIVGILVVSVPMAVLANGTEEPTQAQPAQPAQPAVQQVPPPTGAGPAEIAAGISVESISAIQQRGHSRNACEALAMTEQFVKQRGGQKTFGDYQVAYMLDPPKGWYEMKDGTLTWKPPAPGETQHIEVAVMDSLTGQPIPVGPITLDVVDQQGSVVQSQQLAYYWHPMADHYGANYSIPTAGSYNFRVRAPAPDFRRHDRAQGNRFTSPLDATFSSVSISPKAPESSSAPTASETAPAAPPTGAGASETAQPTPPSEQPQPSQPANQ